jgi:hypothetical protein
MTIMIWNTHTDEGPDDAMIYGYSKDMRAAAAQGDTEENELGQAMRQGPMSSGGHVASPKLSSSSPMKATAEQTIMQHILGKGDPASSPLPIDHGIVPATEPNTRPHKESTHIQAPPFSQSLSTQPLPYTMPPSWSSIVPQIPPGYPLTGSNFITNVVSGRDVTSYNDESVEVLHEIRDMLSKDAKPTNPTANHQPAVSSLSRLKPATTDGAQQAITNALDDETQKTGNIGEGQEFAPAPSDQYGLARTLLLIVLAIGGIIVLFITFTRKRTLSQATLPFITDNVLPPPAPLPPMPSDPLSYDTPY